MNLREFLDYRKCCPICNSSLNLYFATHRNQNINYIDNRLVVKFNLKDFKTADKYKIGYSIDFDDNSLFIDYYHNNIKMENAIPTFLLQRTKELHKNLGLFNFSKICNICQSYSYCSNRFEINPFTIGDLQIFKEYFGISELVEDGYKIYRLTNYYDTNKSNLFSLKENKYSDFSTKEYMSNNSILVGSINTSLIKFTDKQSIINRIDNLLWFT